MNYYNKITNIIEKKEVNDRVRKLQTNKDSLNAYYEIGKLLVEAQGGETKSKYGDNLIKKWSKKLIEIYGNGYSVTNLKYMRKFYIIQKGQPLADQLTWTHWTILLPIKNENERNYYINQCILNNLSKRSLIKLIKEKAFHRLSYADKNNIKLINESIDNYDYSLSDMLLDPIIISIPNNIKLSEKVLRKYILEKVKDFFLQLGAGFLYAGSEYKLKVLDKNFYIDMLLFNTNLNCYIVVELKLNHANYKDISQVELYRNLVDETLKKSFHKRTLGLIISKKNDKFIFEYVNDDGIYMTSYEIDSQNKVCN